MGMQKPHGIAMRPSGPQTRVDAVATCRAIYQKAASRACLARWGSAQTRLRVIPTCGMLMDRTAPESQSFLGRHLATGGGTRDAAPSAMAEVLIEYDTTVVDSDGRRWAARACGRPSEQKMWEGWIEFVPLDPERRPLRSPQESTQPSREALLYWATGLTSTYLKGALNRALQPPLERPKSSRVKPHFAGPAPSVVPASPSAGHPILDPFNVYAQGEDILLRQLDALDTARLREIVIAFELMRVPEARNATRLELATTIVEAARASATRV